MRPFELFLGLGLLHAAQAALVVFPPPDTDAETESGSEPESESETESGSDVEPLPASVQRILFAIEGDGPDPFASDSSD